ncbi:MAG: DUF4054 domain-containing protein [Myxococcota bacterium]
MALTIDKADVLLVAGELSSLTDAQWAQVLADVALEVDVGPLTQAQADRLGVQLAAHLATERYATSGGGGAAGPLQSVTVGPVSKSFAVASHAQNSALGSTKYGREYLRLVRLFGRRLAVT